MKKTIAAVFLMAFTQADLQSVAEQNVQKHISSFSPTAQDYQPVAFGKLEKFMLPFDKTKLGQGYLQQAKVSLDMAKKGWEQLTATGWSSNKASLAQQVEDQEKDVEKWMHAYDSAAKKYIPDQYGWLINHTYKLKDEEGNIWENENTFYLDKNLSVVDADTINCSN